jgi:hypothetical protein
MPYLFAMSLLVGCFDLYLNDELLADAACERFTLKAEN